MKLPNGLTKENFWDAAEKKYPNAMAAFYKWIDEYKIAVDWKELFNHGTPNHFTMGWHNTKFHNIPYDMQYGIWLRYLDQFEPDITHLNLLGEYAIPLDELILNCCENYLEMVASSMVTDVEIDCLEKLLLGDSGIEPIVIKLRDELCRRTGLSIPAMNSIFKHHTGVILKMINKHA